MCWNTNTDSPGPAGIQGCGRYRAGNRTGGVAGADMMGIVGSINPGNESHPSKGFGVGEAHQEQHHDRKPCQATGIGHRWS